MKLLLLSQLRFLRQAPWSACTALLGVTVGVASVVAVHLISVAVQQSVAAGAPPHLGTVTHLLERPGLDGDDYFRLRAAWRRQRHSAVRAMWPVLEDHALVAERSALVVGADWLAMPVAEGGGAAGLRVPLEVLLGEAVLLDASFGRSEGDVVTIGDRTLGVAGVLDSDAGALVLADLSLVQQLDPGAAGPRLSRIALQVEDPWQRWRRWLDRLMPGFSAGLPELPAAAATLLPLDAAAAWQLRDARSERPSAAFARSVLFNLGALGTLALLVAWFLVYQVAVIWLRRQHLVLERLHVAGAATAVLRTTFLASFTAMGLLATGAGLLLGSALAEALVALSSRGLAVAATGPGAPPEVDGWVAGKALISGLGVCLLAGWAAFADQRSRRPWSPWWRRLLVPALLALALLGIVQPASGVLGGFVSIFALCMLTVLGVGPLLTLMRRLGGTRRPRQRQSSLLMRLALRELAWYPRIVSIALGALALAVATGMGIGLMVESFRLDFQRMLEHRLAGDLYVYDAGERMPVVQQWLHEQPEVAATSRFGRADVRVGGEPAELGYARFDAAESARYRYPDALAPGEALISEGLARRLGAAPGDTLSVGPAAVRVVGTFPGFGAARGRLLVDTATLARLGLPARFDRLTVTLRSEVDLAERLLEQFPGVAVESRAALRAQALAIFDRTFAISQALTLLALLVAVVGMYNALTALKLNQAPTARLLHAQGVSQRELRRLATARAATAGGLSVLLSLPLGLAMAWLLCGVINPRSFGWTVELQLPPQGWLPPLLLGLLAALLAGLLPAPRERGDLHGPA